MRAMILDRQGEPLRLAEIPVPDLSPTQVRLRVKACGLCRTDLHVVDGDLKEPKLPLVPGHQIVGTVDCLGSNVTGFTAGERIGVPWLGGACGECRYCQDGQENLCDHASYTGYQIDGGLAEFCVADARFCFHLAQDLSDTAVAPLLCAGLIGYRALRMVGDAQRIGFYGFGSAAHLMAQVAHHQERKVYAFTRAPDRASQSFALQLGAVWAGASAERPPVRARRRRDLRTGRGSGSSRTQSRPQGRHGCLRWNPHERHSELSLLCLVGRARPAFRGQSDPHRRRGIPGHCTRDGDSTRNDDLPARENQSGARRFASRLTAGGSGRQGGIARARQVLRQAAFRLQDSSTMANTMRVMAAASCGPIENLREMSVPLPEPGEGEVRVRLVASALNPADGKTEVDPFGRTRNGPS